MNATTRRWWRWCLALQAHQLYLRDEHYTVIGGEVVVVDSNTGRPAFQTRWQNGLHQVPPRRHIGSSIVENMIRGDLTPALRPSTSTLLLRCRVRQSRRKKDWK